MPVDAEGAALIMRLVMAAARLAQQVRAARQAAAGPSPACPPPPTSHPPDPAPSSDPQPPPPPMRLVELEVMLEDVYAQRVLHVEVQVDAEGAGGGGGELGGGATLLRVDLARFDPAATEDDANDLTFAKARTVVRPVVVPHPTFSQVPGTLDVHLEWPVTPREFYCGAVAEFDALDGVRTSVAYAGGGTQAVRDRTRVRRLPGLGLSSPSSAGGVGRRGDAYVTFVIAPMPDVDDAVLADPQVQAVFERLFPCGAGGVTGRGAQLESQ